MLNRMRCSSCGKVLHEDGPYPPELSGERGVPRAPCPDCGSTTRSYEAEMHANLSVVASVSAKVQRAWNSDRLAVLLFLLSVGVAAGLAIGLPAGNVLLGIGIGIAAIVVAAIVVWALVRGPLSRVAADAMYKISGR